MEKLGPAFSQESDSAAIPVCVAQSFASADQLDFHISCSTTFGLTSRIDCLQIPAATDNVISGLSTKLLPP